jgi:O-antigen/teichoic acid export membrane protein
MAITEAQPLVAGWGQRPGLRTALRYGASACGPIAVSGAHFLASLIFLRLLSAHEFGLFSFVMVVVAFGMSAVASLAIVPITQMLVKGGDRASCFKANWLACFTFGTLLFAALAFSHAPLPEAGVLGLFGAAFAWRWFARNMAYIDGRMHAAIASDLLYSAVLTLALGALAWLHRVSFTSGSEMLLLAALVALVPFGADFLRDQIAALRTGSLRAYGPIFYSVSRWSLVGVVLTEVTVNAHAYLVTFISGPGQFALLALGMLLMRPASLVQSALPDMERPAMARAIAAHDLRGLDRIRRHFSWGLMGAWAATMTLAAAILVLAPHLLLKKGYALEDVVVVALLSATIMAIRTWRTPLAVLLQAAGEYKALAAIGTVSSVVSVLATLALLLTVGPVASLGGIILGELVILYRVQQMARVWRASHA